MFFTGTSIGNIANNSGVRRDEGGDKVSPPPEIFISDIVIVMNFMETYIRAATARKARYLYSVGRKYVVK